MTCQRCNSLRANTATAVVRGEILDHNVCINCAREAAELGLHVEPHCEVTLELDPAARPAAAEVLHLFSLG
jgi:protein-arginine kinase activator protein McsA